uniref:PfkB domain-containing protein n=1 Tax=Elaeophora elaphi TaxID=1147741 RepID=A0A0R3RQS5_9BILA
MDKRILVVGLSCVDIINYVANYPVEDSDSRILEQIWTAGGNATNNVIVLNQLNSYSILFSVIPINCPIIVSLLSKVGVSSECFLHRLNGDLPTSTVIVNEKTGTRTIMHYRGQLQEPNCEEFQLAFPNINIFSWIHFEGRNFENLLRMINYILLSRKNDGRPRISLECEKVRDFETLENAIPLVDVIFVSKDFARYLYHFIASIYRTSRYFLSTKLKEMIWKRTITNFFFLQKGQFIKLDQSSYDDFRITGFQNKEEAVFGIQQKYGASRAIVICPWAEQGAAARNSVNGEMISVDAYVQDGPAIDTLGAGDCFIACCIHFLNEGNNLREVLVNASRITGKKVAKRGLLGLDVS